MYVRTEAVSERGFSLIELMVALSMVAILVAVAIPNYQQFRVRARDAQALTDYRNLKTVVLAGDEQFGDTPFFLIFNELGPQNLDDPLSKGRLSEGVRLHYAFKFQIGPAFEFFGMMVSHEKGGHFYRYMEINGDRFDQVIDK
jgi:prepilin-type N-terminal cleavage/methylation domain-containing protein